MFGHNQWDIKSFNAFSDESVTKTDDPSIQSISQDIEIPVWSFTEATDSNGHPLEKFERTFDTPFGSVTQHKEVSHPPPFDVTIHNTLTTDTETLEKTLTKTNVKDPFTLAEEENMREYHVWELSGLDEWLVPEEEEEQEEEETEEVEETSTDDVDKTESKPLFCMTCPAGYILGGIGVLALGYMYFIIRNPQAYVQATAIKTGGGLLGQLID